MALSLFPGQHECCATIPPNKYQPTPEDGRAIFYAHTVLHESGAGLVHEGCPGV